MGHLVQMVHKSHLHTHTSIQNSNRRITCVQFCLGPSPNKILKPEINLVHGLIRKLQSQVKTGWFCRCNASIDYYGKVNILRNRARDCNCRVAISPHKIENFKKIRTFYNRDSSDIRKHVVHTQRVIDMLPI